MKLKISKGFTLIELLVVVAIISLLSSIVMASLNSARAKSRDARRLEELHQLDNALSLYASDNNGSFPGDSATYYWIDDNNYPGTAGYSPSPYSCGTSGGLQGYVPSVCSFKDPQGNHYAYVVLPGNTGYKLGAKFELTSNQGAAFTIGAGNPVSGFYERK